MMFADDVVIYGESKKQVEIETQTGENLNKRNETKQLQVDHSGLKNIQGVEILKEYRYLDT